MAPLRVEMTRHKVARGNLFAGAGLPGYRCPWHAHNAGEIYSPVEVASILHTDPVIGVRYFVLVSSLGIELSKPTVYGCNGCANKLVFGPQLDQM